MPVSLFDRIVALLNEASLTDDVDQKVVKLLRVKELTIHQESSLLDNFFEEVAAFQHDTSLGVRKVVISFIQDACLADPTLVKKAVGNLFYLFSSAIQQDPPGYSLLRSLTLSMVPIYRVALTRAVKVGIIESGVTIGGSTGIPADSAADVALETFRSVAGLKDEIVRLLLPTSVPSQSAFGFLSPITLNDSARTGVLRLVEAVIILHSRRLPNSDIPRENEGDISLDQIPDMTNAQLQGVLEASTAASSATLLPGVCLVRPRRLGEEAERLFSGLLDLPMRGKTGNKPISPPVMEDVMDCLVRIAKQRPQFMDRVVQSFETVHVTLPPHFSVVQVGTVRKKLKTCLLQLLRHPASVSDYQGRITILLTDLGATQAEVVAALQRPSDFRHLPPPAASASETIDHGDVDMRQMSAIRPDQAGRPPPTTQLTSSINSSRISAVPTSTASAHPDVAALKTQPPSSLHTTSTDPRLAGQANFSIADAEAALRFDDDDDDDEDDIQIIRSRRPRAKRQSTATSVAVSTSASAVSTTGDAGKMSVAGGKLGQLQAELPSVDFVTNRLVPRLTTANVADLVLLSMVTLPDQMPAAFQSTYTPIAAAGTSAQIRHLARLLAVQLVVWAGEASHPDPTENLSQLESLLRPSQEELEQMAGPGIKRSSKLDGSDAGGLKDGVRAKKRRVTTVGDKSGADNDAEDEDAMIRANAARRMHGAAPMNISTVINYGQQPIPVSSASNLDNTLLGGLTSAPIPGLPPMFPPNVPPPGLGGSNVILPTFDPSQPPPPLGAVQPHSMPSVSSAFGPLATTAPTIPVPVSIPEIVPPASTIPARPFSLDAVTTPLPRALQRQLARDAFQRILDGFEDSTARRIPVGTDNQLLPSIGGTEPGSTTQQLCRMKLLTRLTTRRFGGNEFYSILIDYAIKNLRHGFELLSKLLMQEYCRFRGFQLSEFGDFLVARRRQLARLRDRSRKPSTSSTGGALDDSADDELKRGTEVSEREPELSNPLSEEELERDFSRDAAGSADDQVTEDSGQFLDSPTASPRRLSGSSEDVDHKQSALKTIKPEPRDSKARLVLSPDDLGCLSFYDCLLIDVLQRLSHPDVRQSYFGRFLIEAPLLTAGALSVLKRYCWSASQAGYGFQVLRTLIELRPVGQREDLLYMLLNFCAVDDTEVRKAALSATRELVALNTGWQDHIEAFAINSLKKLLQPRPTADIFPFSTQPVIPPSWNDEACQACAHLFLGLMPQIPALMHDLAEVYVGASPEVKRCTLRMIDTPIREIGLYSADLHDLVDQCPVGAETLITRMLHLLTDSPSAMAAAQAAATAAAAVASSAASSTQGTTPISTPQVSTITGNSPPVIIPPRSLVERVYRLYRERVHDIRCLIPVLVGLPKQDVILALPRLVQLSEKVVKEVLTRLLHASVSTQYAQPVPGVRNVEDSIPSLNTEAPLGPLKPEEILVAIHLLEFAKDPSASATDAKSTKPYISLQAILHACRVCFAERRLFTQERLSAAIGQLLEQPTLPTLFMRTVMQALALHPRLAGYVINVLVRLIRKQVWKSEKLWDGFIRCCVKTRPQSYQVLLQLPPERLEDVFRREPAMRIQVRRYVENFSSAQRIHISKSIVEVLERVPTPPPQTIKGATTADTGSKAEEVLEISTSPPPSPLSSGPGTPTRDEIPHQDLSAAALAVAVAMLGNNATSTQAGAVQPQPYSLLPRQPQPHSPSTFSPPGEASEHHSRSPFGNESYLASTTSSMDQERERGTHPSADDDLEPPTLPPTRIFSTLSKLPDKSIHSDNSDDGTARLLELVDQTPLDWSTEDADDFILRDPKPDDSRQPKRPVDLEKLEADRCSTV
ncbi:hypothetical protein CRM22_004997 [Opisthorchis felineus]|uniref:Symplekin n=1 Tax=Opisthorchis felineus TaxID=147828 RepID=A0A4S2LTB4_OPIFE|nr:hypothetical protein CRM22_004997 [Opisthorchis felineus]